MRKDWVALKTHVCLLRDKLKYHLLAALPGSYESPQLTDFQRLLHMVVSLVDCGPPRTGTEFLVPLYVSSAWYDFFAIGGMQKYL